MKRLFRNYLFLPLFVLLGGFHHVSSYMVSEDFFEDAAKFCFSADHTEKHNFYSGDFDHHKHEATGCEVFEQNQVLKKDWIDKIPLEVFALKNYYYSLFNLLSKRLSLNKPAVIHSSGEAIYLAIRVFRL